VDVSFSLQCTFVAKSIAQLLSRLNVGQISALPKIEINELLMTRVQRIPRNSTCAGLTVL
jgi:hypothetical protein